MGFSDQDCTAIDSVFQTIFIISFVFVGVLVLSAWSSNLLSEVCTLSNVHCIHAPVPLKMQALQDENREEQDEPNSSDLKAEKLAISTQKQLEREIEDLKEYLHSAYLLHHEDHSSKHH